MSRRLLYSLLAALLAVGFTVPLSLPASANIGGSLTAASNTIPGGSSTTVTADFNMTNPVGSGNQVQITLTPNGGNTGTANLQWTSETVPGACTPGANTATSSISCVWDPASNGQVGSVSMTFNASADATGSWTVTSSWTRTNPSGGGTIASTTITVTPPPPSADLSITKSDSPDPVVSGQNLTYTLDYANAGPNTAVGVEVFDVLPAGVTFVSATPDQGSCSAGAGVTCDLGDLTSGASGQITIIVIVDADPGTALTNQAFIQALGGPTDPNAANNSASVTTDVVAPPSADLSITKSDSPDPVLPGGTLVYTLDYANAGPGTAVDVQILDSLPSDVTYVSDDGGCSHASGVVTCNLGDLNSGASGQIAITTTVNPGTEGSVLSNFSTIGSPTTTDPDPANNGANANTTVSEVADISVTKSDSSDPVLPGATLTYTLAYGNAGPSSATSVTIIDSLPTDVTFVSAGLGCAETSAGSGVVQCDLGILDPSETGTRTITVLVAAGADPGDILTNAVVIGMDPSIHDPDTTNNQDSEETTIQSVADMSIGKSDDFDPVAAGGQLTYTIGYDNLGPSDATGVMVVDMLPVGVNFVSATPDQGSCEEVAGVVTCSLGTVTAAADVAQITIVVDVDASLADGSILSNTANITSDQVDLVTGNNSVTETTGMVAVADVGVTKADDDDPVFAGEQMSYEVAYVNNGPSDAANVVVTDTLPAGLLYLSATPDQGTCSESSGTVTCDLGMLPDGGAGTITIMVEVPADATPGIVTNSVTIGTDADDTEADNDTASEETTIETSADLSINKSATPGTVDAGDDVTYTITYSNAGPSDATDVVITDTLPAGLTFVSATPDTGTCSESGGSVTCNVGTVAAGSGGSVLIVVTVPSSAGSGPISNNVTISATTTDPTPGDNESVVDVQVLAQGGSTTTTTTPTTPTTTPSTTTTVAVDSLPLTGSDIRVLGAVGLGMLLLGTLALARRRAETE